MSYLSKIIIFMVSVKGTSSVQALPFDFSNEDRYITQVFNSQLPVSVAKPEVANNVFATQSYC